MPARDGLTFERKLGRLSAMSDSPVIMCTIHNAFEKIRESILIGARAYIMKSFDAEGIEWAAR